MTGVEAQMTISVIPWPSPPMDTADAARRWADTWKSAWEAKDTDAIVALYHPDMHFSTRRSASPSCGAPACASTSARHSPKRRRCGPGSASRSWTAIGPRSSGGRRCVENGVETTLAGTSVLRFDDDGLVVEQRDTWNQADGLREPPDTWGR